MIAHLAAGDRTVWTIALVAFAVLCSAAYTLECVFWPFVPCRRCEGRGKFRAPASKAFRLCPRCGGTARRPRFGRWLWQVLRREGG